MVEKSRQVELDDIKRTTQDQIFLRKKTKVPRVISRTRLSSKHATFFFSFSRAFRSFLWCKVFWRVCDFRRRCLSHQVHLAPKDAGKCAGILRQVQLRSRTAEIYQVRFIKWRKFCDILQHNVIFQEKYCAQMKLLLLKINQLDNCCLQRPLRLCWLIFFLAKNRRHRYTRFNIQRRFAIDLTLIWHCQKNRLMIKCLRREIIRGIGTFRNVFLDRALFTCKNDQCRVTERSFVQ